MPLKRKSACHAVDIISKIQKLEAYLEDKPKPTEQCKARKNVIQIIHKQSQEELLVQDDQKKKKPKTPGSVLTNYLQKSYRKSSEAVSAFVHFVHERQVIYELKSSGAAPPYTNNVVMQSKWFTNMYRELDRGTMYFRKQILAEHSHLPSCYKEVVFKAIVYRLINKIETFDEFGKLPCISEWKDFQRFLGEKMSSGGVIFTSAHQNMGLTRFCLTIKDVLKDINQLTQSIIGAESLEMCFNILKSIQNIGNFFAWQICCDFLELRLINFDENSWTCLGPGAKAGLRRIFVVKSEKEELPLVLQLTKIMDYSFKALGLQFPHFLNKKLTLKIVEHALCEYDKYFRAATNQPTRERIFHSRSSLDCTTCMVCKKTGATTRCVLCGSSCHLTCLESEDAQHLVGGKWWLCPGCNKLEGKTCEDFSPVFAYNEVKDKYKIRPITINIRTLCMKS